MAKNPCKYIIEIKPGEFKEMTEPELKDYLLNQDLSNLKPIQDAIQERSAEEKVSRPTGARKNITESSEGIRSSQQRAEATEEAQSNEEAIRGITKAEIEQRRLENGLPVVEGKVVTDAEIKQQAAEQIANGYDFDALIQRMEQGQGTSAVESEILKIYAATLDKALVEDPFNKKIQKDLARFTEAKLISAATMGRDFRALQGTAYAPLEQLQTLSDYVTVVREANGVDELTDNQMKKVIEDYEKIQKEVEKLKKEKEELQDLNAKMLADQEMAKVNTEVKKEKKEKAPKRDYKKEREDIFKSIKEKWNRASKGSEGLTAVPLPFSAQLYAISPDVAKLVKIYAEDGVSKLDDVVNNIYDLLKDGIEGITKKDIVDIIAGKYKEKEKKALNEAKANLANINKEAKLASAIYDLKYGPKQELTEKKQIEKNAEISSKEKELRELRKESGYYDESKLKSLIARNEAKANEIKRKIENKEFEPTPRPESFIENPELKKKYPYSYNKYLDGLNKIDEMKHQFLMAAEKDKLEKEGKLGKAKQLGKEFLNTVMALKSGIDNSVVFVQNSSVMLDPESWGIKIRKQKGRSALNPFAYKINITKEKPALQALKFQKMAFASEAALRRRLLEIYDNKPLWNMIEKSGLDILDPKGFKTKLKEESFGKRNLLERVGADKYITAPFERLFSGFSNEIRLSLFIQGSQELMDQGKTIENSLKDYQDLASKVNNLTGRGETMFKSSKSLQSAVLWSPKLLASTLNKLGLSDLISNKLWGKKDSKGRPMGYYSAMNKEGREKAVQATVRSLSTVFLIMAAAAMQDDVEVDADPESVTFGQIKNTKTGWSINLLGPYGSVVKQLVMLGSSALSSLSGGALGPAQKIGADGEPKKVDVVRESYKFIRGKANPLVGISADIITGKGFSGKPYDIKKELTSDLFEPLFLQDFRKSYQASGSEAILYAIPTFYGLKVQNEKTFDERDLKSLLDNNVSSSSIDRNSIFNYKDKINKGRRITKSEFNEFAKKNDALLKEFIEVIYKNGFPVTDEKGNIINKKVEGEGPNVATKQELADALSKIKKFATRITKLDMFGQKEAQDPDVKADLMEAWAELGIGDYDEE
jgi:hypothetical protein